MRYARKYENEGSGFGIEQRLAPFVGRLGLRILSLIWIGCLLGARAGAAQEAEAWDLPDTPQGHHAAAYLTALNKHDDDHTRAFIREHFAPGVIERNSVEDLLREFKIDQEEQGIVKLESYKVKESGELEIVVASEVTGERLQIGMMFENAEPYRIAGVGVLVIP
jgi:hypothetical protein